MPSKNVSQERFERLLERHNNKFPNTKLTASISSTEIVLQNVEGTFKKIYTSIDNAFNYLVGRFYYYKDGESPKLGKGNGNKRIVSADSTKPMPVKRINNNDPWYNAGYRAYKIYNSANVPKESLDTDRMFLQYLNSISNPPQGFDRVLAKRRFKEGVHGAIIGE